MKTITLQIPSILENIRIVESFVDNIKLDYNINDDIYGNILVSVTEAVNNAIVHGCKEDSAKVIDFNLILLTDSINIRITDQGEGFDFTNLPDPLADDFLDTEGGRGIYLMKQLSDELRFHNNGSTVELVFYTENLNA